MLDVLLNPPLPAFARLVRAYETMTASRILVLPVLVIDGVEFGSGDFQRRPQRMRRGRSGHRARQRAAYIASTEKIVARHARELPRVHCASSASSALKFASPISNPKISFLRRRVSREAPTV